MENTKTVKALKKQLVAAIAMVLVAAVALGSSTYAWFVSNNSVKGTTTTISAQSNSAYLVIDSKETSTSSKAIVALKGDNVALYPATIDKSETNDAVWSSAYAATTSAATMKADTKFQIDDGTAAKAEKAGYAKLNTFYIGTGTYDGTFTNLKVTGVEVNNTSSSQLNSAMRVLVTCGDEWVVWSSEKMENGSRTDGVIKVDSITKNSDATVMVYVYYDGSDSKVFTTNLENIAKDCGVTVTFEATPTEFK